jgi:DivIVA domain-containing protein
MAQLLLLTIGALVVGAIGFGVAVLISGSDPGLQPVEPDGRAVALPASRPLIESDFGEARFDTTFRGYRMAQVDTALRRAAYDIGYKQELIGVLEAEVSALRDGRTEEAEKLRAARETALSAIAGAQPGPAESAGTAGFDSGEPAAAEVRPGPADPADPTSSADSAPVVNGAPVVDTAPVVESAAASDGSTGAVGETRLDDIAEPDEMRLR